MSADNHSKDIRARLHDLIHHFEHVLPAQAPIKDFVHHNTLHGFQHLPFDQALAISRKLTGAQGYLPEERYRAWFSQGRINHDDLVAALDSMTQIDAGAVLAETSGGPLLRRDVLLPALLHPFKRLSRSQLKWQIEELHALETFQDTVEQSARARLLATAGTNNEKTALDKLWVACLESLGLEHELRHPEELLNPSPDHVDALAARIADETGHADEGPLATQLIRKDAAHLLDTLLEKVGEQWTLRDLLMALTGEDLLVDARPLLIRHLAAHLDQGMAAWHNPGRQKGFYAAWRESAGRDLAWVLNDLSDWRMIAERLPDDPFDTIIQELRLFGLPEERWEGYLERLALEIPGWSGMTLWRHNHPGYGGMTTPVDMMDYLAVRLVLERLFAQRLCRRHWRIEATLSALRWYFRHIPAELVVRHALFEGRLPEYLISFAEQLTREAPNRKENIHDEGWQTMAQLLWSWQQTPAADRRDGVSVSGSAWPLFCLAQHLGLAGSDITAMGRAGVDALLHCLNLLDADQRGHVWLLAYERHYREQIFTALKANHGRGPWMTRDPLPQAQLVFCMDDREEGIRRHLEEINPQLETLGAAAHFGIFMNWRGLDDQEAGPLCPVVPVVIIPTHEIREVEQPGQEPQRNIHDRRHDQRMRWSRRLHQNTRRGLIVPALIAAAAAPAALAMLGGKLLAPARLGLWAKKMAAAFDQTVPTQVAVTAPADSPAATPEAPRLGFTDSEQVERVFGFLRNIGLTTGFAPLVVIAGHGSNSQNNPHLAAYDCGACSGRHSGPNARVFVTMVNRPEIRALLAEKGIAIPDGTWFVAAEHNTCDDIVTWYDEDRIPEALHTAFARLRQEVAQASRQHAQERCRRFASAPDNPGLQKAWRHIQNRRHDFSQARPELGHATNACAFIGRRSMSYGAFFDRRAFLISYDSTIDPEGLILERHLLINGPVGAGIALEYYFSMVDNDYYGCSTKTMHNVSGLFGVMEGASSDLRTGLPRQMIEIHEPMRLLVVVEAKIDIVTAIYQRQSALQELVGKEWVVVAAKDPDSADIQLFDPARGWLPWHGDAETPPTVACSYDWFNNQREPLPPALLRQPAAAGDSA
ncbi:MAG: DUF2309 domain-containing protein [Gammaproteobacteria bacterium]|nr:DUF2309 domain-containing protein [Gammaproteobacteria bacterium]